MEKKFLDLDINFRRFRDLKNLYTDFNYKNLGKEPFFIKQELEEILKVYRESEQSIFIDFVYMI